MEQTVFLTSSPTGPLDGSRKVDGLDGKNGFVDKLRAEWKQDSKCLMIAASPENYEGNDEMTGFFENAVKRSRLSVSGFDLWDGRTMAVTKDMLDSYDVIFLGGGHVPTQNRFFGRLGLRELIRDFKGIIIGISAGTMNSADVVYAQPELPGESVDPEYHRFLTGLGLTKTMILPHYQMVKDFELDGKRLYEDITFEDSHGRRFLVLPDGSYLMKKDGLETVWGEAYEVRDGHMEKIGTDGAGMNWEE